MFNRENGKVFLIGLVAAAVMIGLTFRVQRVEQIVTGKSDN